MKVSKAERQAALDHLREILSPGDTVYTILRHCSRSGAFRVISLTTLAEKSPTCIDGWASKVIGCARDHNREGLRISGGGMDMGFQMVYRLAGAIWPDGHECSGEDCPSNDHSNGDRDYTPHQHKDGGYALRRTWL